MNYPEYIYQILGFVGLPALFTLYLTERVKGNIKSTYDRKLEEIKKENTKEIEEVKKEHSKEISQFQSELNYLKSKENFKFTKLHESRLLVLKKTYMYLNTTSESLTLYISPVGRIISNRKFGDSEDEILKDEFIKRTDAFTFYFNRNAIYFDETLGDLLRNFLNESIVIFATYHSKNGEVDNSFAITQLNDKLFPIKKQIELKFRELLGE